MHAEALGEVIRPSVDAGDLPGAIIGVVRDGEVSLQALGTTRPGGDTALTVDTLMRISSNTKPLVAALTLALVEEGILALTDPVEQFLPELANRRVLRRLDGRLEDTVPAERPMTIEDVLTMRLGFGFVFESPCPALVAATQAGLGIGPPDPSNPLTPDEWLARFAQLPLMEHPGTVWRYDLAYAVLGIGRPEQARCPLDELLHARILQPLNMVDTAFVASPGRLPPCFAASESGLVVFDEATHSRWATPPSFSDARGGLVSTAADLLRFAGALLEGGSGVITPEAVVAMTTDHLTSEQRGAPSAQAFLNGSGWGYGVQVVSPKHDASVRLPRYGWGGGLGTLWYSWPQHNAAAVLLTQVLPPSGKLIASFLSRAEAILPAS